MGAPELTPFWLAATAGVVFGAGMFILGYVVGSTHG